MMLKAGFAVEFRMYTQHDSLTSSCDKTDIASSTSLITAPCYHTCCSEGCRDEAGLDSSCEPSGSDALSASSSEDEYVSSCARLRVVRISASHFGSSSKMS